MVVQHRPGCSLPTPLVTRRQGDRVRIDRCPECGAAVTHSALGPGERIDARRFAVDREDDLVGNDAHADVRAARIPPGGILSLEYPPHGGASCAT